MKWISAWICVILVAGSAYGQTTAEDTQPTKKILEQIVGEWKLQRIVDAGQRGQQGSGTNREVTRENNENQAQNGMQQIEFDRNARYKLNNATTSLDSGSFRVNERHGILYLESDQSDLSPMEWKLTLEDDELTLVGRGQDAPSRYKYVYQRVEEGG